MKMIPGVKMRYSISITALTLVFLVSASPSYAVTACSAEKQTSDGRWVRDCSSSAQGNYTEDVTAEHNGAGELVPANFRGKVTYDGYMEGNVTVPGRGNLINQALNTRTVPVRASYHVEVEYDGNSVKGSEVQRSAEPGASGTATFRGSRAGNRCEVVIDQDGLRVSATCTNSEFSYPFDYSNLQGQRVKGRVVATRSSREDYVERDRAAAIQAQQDARAATQVRQQLASSAPQQSGKAPPKEALAYFDGLIAEDASSWVFNQYDRGSMHNVKIISSTNAGRTKVVYGDYTYNGGSAGWVKAQFENGALSCVEFWDFQGQCRALGHSPSHSLAAGFAGALASGIVNGGSGSGSTQREDEDERYGNWVERNQQQGLNDNGTPK